MNVQQFIGQSGRSFELIEHPTTYTAQAVAQVVHVPGDEVAKITHANALRLFSFDAFAHVPKAAATVGALRAQAGDVDLGYRSSARLKKEGTSPVSVLDLVQRSPFIRPKGP